MNSVCIYFVHAKVICNQSVDSDLKLPGMQIDLIWLRLCKFHLDNAALAACVCVGGRGTTLLECNNIPVLINSKLAVCIELYTCAFDALRVW